MRKHLEDPDFEFWLTLFHKIFPHIEILFQQFQSTKKNSVDLLGDISEFENQINKIRNITVDELQILQNKDGTELPHRRMKIDPTDGNYRLAKEVCDTIIIQLKDRLA